MTARVSVAEGSEAQRKTTAEQAEANRSGVPLTLHGSGYRMCTEWRKRRTSMTRETKNEKKKSQDSQVLPQSAHLGCKKH